MASVLAQQLAGLQAVLPPGEKHFRGKPSLLFDFRKAADTSSEALLTIAQAGLEVLCKADKRFNPFPESLFSRASLSVSRDSLTKEENAQLDANLRAFLHVLTNHFLAPAAFQVLEYCIRRYKVHVYNVSDLFVAALPYHSTPEFARLVGLMQLKATPWEWLAPCQQSGAPPPRQLLVTRCVNDLAVLREVCRGAQALGMAGFVSKTYLAFYAVLLCEVLMATPQVTEDLLTCLLPFLVAGLKESAARDYTAATLMVLTQLLSRATLSQDFLSVVSSEVARVAPELGASTSLMLLAHMAASQPHLTALPAKTLVLLAEQEDVGQLLAGLAARGAKLEPLLQLLLPSLTQALPAHDQLQRLLLELLHNLPLQEQQVQAAALQLLQAGAKQQDEAAAVRQVLRVLDSRYPDQLDAAINEALQQATVASAPAAAAGSKHKKGKQAPADANSVFAFVQRCFHGSRHEVVEVAATADAAAGQQQQQQRALTLSLAVSAPASEMRVMALQKLDALCSSSSDCDDALKSTRQLLHSSLLSCLRDEVLAVAATAAAAAGLAEVPVQQQLPALKHLLARAAAQLTSGSSSQPAAAAGSSSSSGSGREALKAAKAALAAVAAAGARAAAAAAAGDEEAAAAARQAAALLLEHALADKQTKKLAMSAVSAAAACSWHPALAVLASSAVVSAALQDAPAAAAAEAASQQDSKSKRKKKPASKGGDDPAAAAVGGKHAAALALNRAVVAALASSVVAGGGAALLQELSALAAVGGARCQHLVVLALINAAALAVGAGGGMSVSPDVPPPTPSRGRGKGKQHARISSSSQDGGAAAAGTPVGDSAAVAHIAAALFALLEQQLALPAAAAGRVSKKKKKDKAAAAAPSDVLLECWEAAASELLDADSLPSKQHLQQLHSHLQQVNAALLVAGVRSSLVAAPADALAHLLGQPVVLFARLAAAAAAAAAIPAAAAELLDIMQLLVSKAGQGSQQQLQFLASIYGLPASSCCEAAQVCALQLLHRQPGSGAVPAVVAAGSLPAAAPDSGGWLVQLLAAADSSSKAVREAALDALLALPGLVAGSSSSKEWQLPGGFAAEQLEQLVSGLAAHEGLLRDSAGALTRLLCSTVANTAMDVDSGSGGGARGQGSSSGGSSRPRRGKAAAGARGSAAGDDEDAATAELHLPAACTQVLLQLLTAVLPVLHEEAQLLAASLAMAVLSGSTAANDEAAAAVASAASQLLQQLVAGLCEHDSHVAAVASKPAVQQPGWQLLAGDAAAAADAAAEQQKLRTAAAAALLLFFTPAALQAGDAAGLTQAFVDLLQLPFVAAADGAFSTAVAGSQGGRLSAAQLAAVAPVRAAALHQLDAALFAALPAAQRQAVFTAALTAHTTDGDSGCRAAARAALEQLPVDAGMLLALLCKVGSHAAGSSQPQQQQHKAKRSKRASSASQADAMDVDAAAGAVAGPVLAADLDAATAALELLMWKEDVADRQQLVQPMQQLLRQLIPVMGSIAEPHREGLGQDEEQQEAAGDADASAGAEASARHAAAPGLASPSAAGYAASLVLLVLRLLAQEKQQHAAVAAAGSSSRRHKAAASASGIDAALVLSCASAAADGAVRNAALQLLTVMAQLAPEDMLSHVLQALSVVQQSAALQDDAHSQAVAAATLAALVPAWLEAGRGSQELWDSLIGALPGLPAPRRLALLEALLAAMPQELGLPVGLLLMMRRVVAPHAPAAAPEAAAGSSKTPSKGNKAAAAAAAPATPAASAAVEAGQEESQWLPDLMAALCEKVEVPQRLQAFSAVLQSSLDAANNSQAGDAGNSRAYLPLPRLAVTFVSANLKAKSVLAAARTPAAAPSVQLACQAIMSAALQHLQFLNPQAAASAAASPSKSARRTHKAIRAAAAGIYELLSSLESVQDCSSYLAALVEMSRHNSAAVSRRALKLLAARLARAAVDLADVEAAAEQLPAAEQAARLQQLARAGLSVCGELPRLLQAEQPLSRQLALVAADAGIRQFGHVLPAAVLDSLPAVVAAVKDPSAPVRVSALVCVAAGIAAVGQKLVPLLPATAAAVMEAAQEACRGLAGFSHARHAAQQEAAADEDAAAAAGHSDDEEEAEAGGSAGADAALQLAGALAALEALVAALGPFLSPYLKPLLQLLLHREVLGCSTAGAAVVASRLRAVLPGKIPPRLLLEPLISQWDYALSACGSSDGTGSVTAEPAVALLGLVAAMAGSMEPSAAAVYHEQLLGLLLRALDTRHRWLAGPEEQQRRATEAAAAGSADAAAAAAAVARLGAGEVAAIESAAVAALSAVVMKLSESRFKPMFLRMVEWANAGSSGSTAAAGAGTAAGDGAGYGRAAAFLAVVDALGHRLRAVFAPYHRYFSVLLMRHLADDGLTSSAAGGKRPKKKRKSTAAAAGDDDAGPAAPSAVDGSLLSGWLARLRAVRAVHLIALHEPPGSTPAAQQEQQERYDRLVPLLVEQLSEGPPPPVAALMADQEPDGLLDLAGGPVAALGAAGKAAVEAGGGAVLQACDLVGTAALGALLQIASAGGSDVVWKPLHHALLMATRGGSVRAKLLALGGVSRLAELLREEYLMLLPEALPFVAELMEDGEVAVEGAVQGLVAQLEALSGERLEQYLKA